MQPIDWNDLRDFVAVARAGQIARAAKALQVDATTVGRRIRRLERRMGQMLFEQTRQGQMLTEAGEQLLARIEPMALAAHALEPHDPHAGVSGLVRVSVSEGFGTWFVAHHLHQFLARHPQVGVDLVATSGFLSPSKRETDIAVLLARPRSGPVVSRKLTDYALRLYASDRYARRDSLPADRRGLSGHRLIGYIPEFIYANELNYLAELDASLETSVRSTSINAQYRLVASGAGIGLLPAFIGNADPHLIPVLPDIVIHRSFWIVTHRDTRKLARVRAFHDWLVETVQAHAATLTGTGDPTR